MLCQSGKELNVEMICNYPQREGASYDYQCGHEYALNATY